MLSSKQISDLLDNAASGLAIIPRPQKSKALKRAATSIDLRLGRWFTAFRQTHASSHSLLPPHHSEPSDRPPSKDYFIRFGSKFVIHPGRFVLGSTLEWVTLPPTISGYVTGKSSLGRMGLVIETAAGIHPGFSGCLTLELANVGEVPLELSPGMEVCQVFLHDVEDAGAAAGAASGYRKPAFPERGEDAIFDRLCGRAKS